MYRSRTISVFVAASPAETYRYAANPANLPAWASGFVASIEQRADHWVAQTTLGEVSFWLAPPNPFGVLDHDVEVSGKRYHNPMRVIPNGDGSEVQFTLLQLPDATDEQFAADADVVLADLLRLKGLVELRLGCAG